MMKVWLPLLLNLLAVCLGQRKYNRCSRAYGGFCRKSLQEYPCSDPDSVLTEQEGKPLCNDKKPYCCIPSPGPTCWGRNGVRGYCGVIANETWVDSEDALQPAENGGLHLSFGDWKCKTANKKTCRTNNLPCGSGGYCGPSKKMPDGIERCVNGQWDVSGDDECPDKTLCCRSVKQ